MNGFRSLTGSLREILWEIATFFLPTCPVNNIGTKEEVGGLAFVRVVRELLSQNLMHRDMPSGVVGPVQYGRNESQSLSNQPKRRIVMHPSITTLAAFGLLSSALMGASGDELGPVTEKLNSNNNREKADAVRTLGEIGPAAADSVSSLLDLVKADNPGLSYESIIALGRINSDASRVIPSLCSVLSSKPPVLKLAAISSLQKFGPRAVDALPLLKKLLENDVPILRISAARAIAEIGIGQQAEIDAVIPVLITGLQSPQRDIATDAIHGLAVIGEPVVAAIQDLLNSSDAQSVRNACDALAAIGPKDASVIEKLVALTKSENNSLRWHAINALGEVGPSSRSIVPILIAGLQDPDSHVRFSAEQALHKMGRLALPALIESLNEEKSQRIVAAIIGGMGPAADAAIEPLSRLLHSPDPGTRREAIFALAQMGSNADAIVPELIEALQDKQFPFPGAAAYALGRLRSKDATEALKWSLKEHKEPLVRLATACALIEIDPDNDENTRLAIPYLTAALKHERPEIRREAARALGRLGKRAIHVASDLQKGLSDKDPDFQRECLDALVGVLCVGSNWRASECRHSELEQAA
jgi:HEAT repeat protein